jgi:hypothetical protein
VSRSGTTLLAALLHANPEIEIRFEAWHSVQPRPPVFSSLTEFDSFYSARRPTKQPTAKIIGFKETFGEEECFEWVETVLDCIEIPVKVIVICRDVAEAYLSNVAGHRKYWGNPDRKADLNEFADGLSHWSRVFIRMNELRSRYGGALVSYKKLVLDPRATLTKLASVLHIPFDDAQLNFHEIVDEREIMGDMGLQTNPKPPDPEIYQARAQEALEFIRPLPKEEPRLAALREFFDLLDEKGVIHDLRLSDLALFSPDGSSPPTDAPK